MATASKGEPVDGFTVERTEENIILTLSSRYGSAEVYIFDLEDARTIGLVLVSRSEETFGT